MSYRLKLNEPVEQAFHRLATEQLERAAGYIEAAHENATTSVHATRKCLKRTRALLRLFRPLMGNSAFADLNGALRDAGRRLSVARDRDVMQQTVAMLKAKRAIKAVTASTLNRALLRPEQPPADEVRYDHLIAELSAIKVRIAEVCLETADDQLPTAGLGRCLDQVRKSFDRAFRSDADEALHEWRKAVQLHWRHMQLLSAAWPSYCGARIEEARAISALAGDARDLGMLLAFSRSLSTAKSTTAELEQCATDRIPAWRAEAKLRGERLLAESTSGFCERLDTYWRSARALRSISQSQ
jgi:CHAD domain-containing protein